MNTVEFLAERMAEPSTQWSLGTFGAIAEFARDPDEPAVLDFGEGVLTAVTARGGIRIAPDPAPRLFASESPTRESWSQRIALCLPEDRCAMNGRTVLTELGPDRAALRDADRDAVLFDLGLGALQVDLCVRTADPALAAQLRTCAGRSVFDPESPAMGRIVEASPHRAFIGRFGRVEVFQPIPPANGKSPDGPHTHVLPKLLAHRRTHSATESTPDGYVPCAHCYPAHPAKDARGDPRPFDPEIYDAFQAMLQKFGDPVLIALKRRVTDAIAVGKHPSAVSVANKRFARAGIRVTLRQLAAAGAPLPALAAWMAEHDGARAGDAVEEDVEPYAHRG